MVQLAFTDVDGTDQIVGGSQFVAFGIGHRTFVTIETEDGTSLTMDVATAQSDGVCIQCTAVVNEVTAVTYNVHVLEDERYTHPFFGLFLGIYAKLIGNLELGHLLEVRLITANDELTLGDGRLQLAHTHECSGIPVADNLIGLTCGTCANGVEGCLELTGIGYHLLPAVSKHGSRSHQGCCQCKNG